MSFLSYLKASALNTGLVVLLMVLATLGPDLTELLRFDRTTIAEGEFWRLLSGNLVHLNGAHALMNIAGLLVITWIFQEQLAAGKDGLALIVCMLGTTLGLYFFSEEMVWYLGFSGALHGYLVYYLIKTYFSQVWLSLASLLLIFLKLAWEQSPWQDTSYTAELIGAPVAVDAHLYGAISGLVVGVILKLRLPNE